MRGGRGEEGGWGIGEEREEGGRRRGARKKRERGELGRGEKKGGVGVGWGWGRGRERTGRGASFFDVFTITLVCVTSL